MSSGGRTARRLAPRRGGEPPVPMRDREPLVPMRGREPLVPVELSPPEAPADPVAATLDPSDLPQRVPAEPDVPDVPDDELSAADPLVDPVAAPSHARALSRIADKLRHVELAGD